MTNANSNSKPALVLYDVMSDYTLDRSTDSIDSIIGKYRWDVNRGEAADGVDVSSYPDCGDLSFALGTCKLHDEIHYYLAPAGFDGFHINTIARASDEKIERHLAKVNSL